MDPGSLFPGEGRRPGISSTITTLQPAHSLDFRESDWAGAIVVVVRGRLHLECRSGRCASFDEGAVLFLTGLDLRRITNPGLTPLVLKSISPRLPGDAHVSSTTDLEQLVTRARTLKRLHTADMLVLPNAWDAASARVVESAGFHAVATTSAAIAAVLGYADGEGAPWEEMFAANARIARAVAVPVTMDAEAGYGIPPADLVRRLLDIGVVGCNLEDSDHSAGGLKDRQHQAAWLAEVRSAADDAAVPLVINARVDVFLPTSRIADEERTAEAVRRGRSYREAGADCIYPIGVADPATLSTLVAEIGGPINGNSNPNLPLSRLRAMGVARVSYGPRFYRAALADLGHALEHL
jgi:2-methylisocitrate lyase-like PEP mutase family enzyme